MENRHGQTRSTWHDNIEFVLHTRTHNVVSGMPSSPLYSTNGRTMLRFRCHHRPWTTHTIVRQLAWHASIVLGSTHGRTTLSVACPHRPCTAHIVRRHRAWQMARNKQCQTMSSITCNHRTSEAYMVRRRLAWHAISRLDSTHGRTTSSVGCHHHPWRAHTIALRRA